MNWLFWSLLTRINTQDTLQVTDSSHTWLSYSVMLAEMYPSDARAKSASLVKNHRTYRAQLVTVSVVFVRTGAALNRFFTRQLNEVCVLASTCVYSHLPASACIYSHLVASTCTLTAPSLAKLDPKNATALQTSLGFPSFFPLTRKKKNPNSSRGGLN